MDILNLILAVLNLAIMAYLLTTIRRLPNT